MFLQGNLRIACDLDKEEEQDNDDPDTNDEDESSNHDSARTQFAS